MTRPFNTAISILLRFATAVFTVSLLAGCAALTGNSEPTDEPDVVISMTAEGREYFVNGETNPDIVVSEGDIVRIELEVTGGRHDWVVDEFDTWVDYTNAGETNSVTFIADTSGTFEYYCSNGSHRADGMVGNFIVEPSP